MFGVLSWYMIVCKEADQILQVVWLEAPTLIGFCRVWGGGVGFPLKYDISQHHLFGKQNMENFTKNHNNYTLSDSEWDC